MATKGKEKKLFVLDTNVILHDDKCIRKFQEHDVCILTVVLEELDTFKKNDDTKGSNVRAFHRDLKQLSKVLIKKKMGEGKNPEEKEVPAIAHGGVSLGDGLGKIEIQISSTQLSQGVKKAFNDAIPDHQILNKVYELQKSEKGKRKVILVTKDTNLHFKAQALGLDVEDYENDKIPENEELYLEIPEVKDPYLEKIITELYETKTALIFYDGHKHSIIKEKLKPNMFLILNDGRRSTLAHVDNRMEYFHIVQKEKEPISTIIAKNGEQTCGINALLNPGIKLVVFTGKAGTGKTLLPLAVGIKYLKENKLEKIIMSSAMVEMGGKNSGALPGNAIEKVLPFMNGFHNNLDLIKKRSRGNKKSDVQEVETNVETTRKRSSQKKQTVYKEKEDDYISTFQKEGKIEIQPLNYIRGSTFNNALFIIDECQNLTRKEILTIITRAGEGTKVVLCGDNRQIDTPYLDARSNGLSHVIHRMGGSAIVAHVHLVKGERSELAELAADLL
ncbi:MAG: PhoH family protein [bacterium]